MTILIRNTTPWLNRVSEAARAEWDKLCERIPKDDDVGRGYVELSEPEIEGMYSKFKRFHEIVRSHHADLRSLPPLETTAPPRPAAGGQAMRLSYSPFARA